MAAPSTPPPVDPAPTPPVEAPPSAAAVKRRRWVLLGIAGFFFLLAFFSALDPFGDKGYVGISHGDHTHYVPEDRDPDVSISNFPGTPPGPNERILPDGRVVPR
jgi:hypothetical protein